MSKFHKGDAVTWRWGAHQASGEIAETFTRKVRRTIRGRQITRKGTRKRPAYLIRQDDGSRVLKLETELSRA
ncbi:DUF2945 domain-containing protein [Paracoccus laeviglucosivorans]|uniref:Hypervirulence associated protein TUDOR domain-containing protein n=1 Tax=Paracoccus laeviglucosivorans TaxID=1197861 RepID=A0A521AVI5_9RHOB|nr:DUF2945 domain-containing protein [Paracoccus laeviglucosivorans]SMO38846.1 hypothetical protein SAMN06265221_101405 [Paracoccus laeviglucosivorans]